MLVRALTQSLKIISIAALTILVVVGAFGFFDYWTDRQQSELIGRPVTLTISEEDDGGAVAERLVDAGLVRSEFYFSTRFRFSGDDLRPGTYTLRHGMSVVEIIDTISLPRADDPDSTVAAAPQPISVTFIEGQRIEQYAEALVDAGWPGDPEAFIRLARTPLNLSGWDFLERMPSGASLEGFLFPDTYTFGSDATAQDVINLMLGTFDARFSNDMRQQARASGMSVYEVVTVASIVEREVVVPEESAVVAGLYLNRLDEGMLLQADPTLQYVVGTAEDWWPVLDTRLIEQSRGTPYDTYTDAVPGLPFGPISNPGLRSLQAVLNPEEHGYIFMVARNDGSGTHAFTDSLAEHERNICEYNPGFEICVQDGGNPTTVLLEIVPRDPMWSGRRAA